MSRNHKVAQSGHVTPGHLVAWTTDGVIQDAGTPAQPFVTGGLGILSSNTTSFSIVNNPVSGAYSSLSLGITASAANLTIASFGGAAPLPFNIVLNGVTIPFPGPAGPFLSLAGGTITGPLQLNSTFNMGASTILWGVLPSAGASAPANAGSGYIVGDVVTLSGGATVSIITVDVSGGVTQFSVQQSGSYTTVPATTLAQTGTTGSGTGLTIASRFGPIAASVGAGSLTSSQGNFVLGYQAGNAITTAAEVTLFGDYAGLQITTGGFNTAFGHRAMGFETTGGNNSAFGIDAMRNTRGTSNCQAFGSNALRAWSGSFNTAIGLNAMQGNEDGVSSSGGINIAIGTNALQGLTATTAGSNIAIGDNVASRITTGNSNVIIGHQSATLITTAVKNVIVGNNAGAALTTQFENVLIGWTAGALTTASSSTIVGYLAGSAATSGANTLYGNRSGLSLTTGFDNLFIGPSVGSAVATTASSNILIGLSSATDTDAAGTVDTLKIQGNGSMPAIKGTALSSTPIVYFPGAKITIGDTGLPTIRSGAGAPSATEPNGSIYLRTDGAANTRLYVSEGGGVWAAVSSS